jgi:hypothetical protein
LVNWPSTSRSELPSPNSAILNWGCAFCTEDERLAIDVDLEVVVGDPAAERLDLHVLSGPELPDRLFDAHARS